MGKRINCILGTMTFGQQVDFDEARVMVDHFLDSGYNEIDSAYVYNEGKTETILGKILRSISRERLKISTKANPRVTGRLDPKSIEMQLEVSLERMGLEYVDVFYLHMPDYGTPIIESLEACAELHSKGRFRRLGISNYPAWMLTDIWHICDKQGWVKPSIYQGLYNALSRNLELELIPAARHLGVKIYAFNPLAGGLLTGKYRNSNSELMPEVGRFALRKSYQARYWKNNVIQAATDLADGSSYFGMEAAETALRWLMHHSLLKTDHNDSILIGASSVSQLSKNLSFLSRGPIAKELLDLYDRKWLEVGNESPAYFKQKRDTN